MSDFNNTVRFLSALFLLSFIVSCSDEPIEEPDNNVDSVDSLPELLVLPHTEWQKYSSNPVLQPTEDNGDWDGMMTNSPTVIEIRDTLRMWYEGSTSIKLDGVIHIGYAWSLDGIEWNRMDAPVLEAIQNNWAYPHLASPIVIEDGDTLRMWFAGGDYTSVGMVVGYATSLDGIHWTRYGTPVIVRDKEWNKGGVLPGPVIKEDGLFKMWLKGGIGHYGYPDNTTKWRTGYATSTNGIHWTVNDEPALEHGGSDAFDESSAVAGSVVRSDNTYEMWYSGFRGRGIGASLGFATSEDGIVWEKYEGNPIMNKSVVSDALYAPWVTVVGEEYHMWYAAWHPGPTIHHAVATN